MNAAAIVNWYQLLDVCAVWIINLSAKNIRSLPSGL
jgi:hypothetical protein